MSGLTNYDLLIFLIADGGHYTRSEHVKLLSEKFPGEHIDVGRVSSLRASMLYSKFVTSETQSGTDGHRAIKVIAVDEQFGRYAYKRPNESKPSPMTSYLLSEPEEVVRTIKLRMEFDNLLRKHHANRDRKRTSECGEAVSR
ncbi:MULTISPECIES: hypothetical protein [unclassified Serratia (in: enterobacteria)]|uniref:hypothetical protein n=1 Tax=unclassified Serratia (in: enterobacteria) TaxID=2647522 RepID=UPI000506A8BE|nr:MULTISPECIES: hypothetical protein [unclassified Serratia (in: enterobacteria)]KFK93578.1 hypothetical protein JV45_15650 [Serratia sp. Ag2]KFK93857.1 hypothetical protein IV04_23485 [Serratia sp. Ag1]